MKKCSIDYTLYLCTDSRLMSTNTLGEAVEKSILGGCTVIQLREKDISSLHFYQTAQEIKKITDKYRVPIIINDRVDIAMAVDADGVHVGQSDLPAAVVRSITGPDKIIGVSVATREEAIRAKAEGADYIGVGAMYPTGTKTDTRKVTMEELKEIRKAVDIPIVVIGGINETTAVNFRGLGIDGIAVVSAIIAQTDITAAAARMAAIFRE